MRQRVSLSILLAFICLSISGRAQETGTLTAPETPPNNTGYSVETLTLFRSAGVIHIMLRGVNNEPKECRYTPTTNPTGIFLLTALNKANLSTAYAGNGTTGSLIQRIFHRLFVMGEGASVCVGGLGAGTVTGSVP